MKIGDYEVHPAAELFPMLPKAELKELADDIKKHGLIHRIVLHNKQILDGRNRLLACEMADVIPYFAYYHGEHSPTEYVIAANLKRRQLTVGQKATAARRALPLLEAEAKERMLRGKKDPTEKIPQGEAREKAAALFGVNPRYVSDAKRIEKESPEIFEQVANGSKTISAAKKELGWEVIHQEPDRLEQLKTIWRQCNKQQKVAFLKWERKHRK